MIFFSVLRGGGIVNWFHSATKGKIDRNQGAFLIDPIQFSRSHISGRSSFCSITRHGNGWLTTLDPRSFTSSQQFTAWTRNVTFSSMAESERNSRIQSISSQLHDSAGLNGPIANFGSRSPVHRRRNQDRTFFPRNDILS